MYIEFDAPDLREYERSLLSYWTKTIFIGSISQDYQVNALAGTYVRLVEAAVAEYNLAQVKLKEFWDTHSSLNLSAMHRSMSHFESCLSSMYRAANSFRKLRRHRSRDPLCVHLNTERPSFATDAIGDRFRQMRHEVHHMEELVIGGRLQPGQPFALKPDGPEVPHPTEPNQTVKTIDRLVIGAREVKFTELAGWLREMVATAQKMADFAPSTSSGPAGDAA